MPFISMSSVSRFGLAVHLLQVDMALNRLGRLAAFQNAHVSLVRPAAPSEHGQGRACPRRGLLDGNGDAGGVRSGDKTQGQEQKETQRSAAPAKAKFAVAAGRRGTKAARQ